jgi:hypothetical protein
MTPTAYRIAAAIGILLLAAACTKPMHKVEASKYGWGPQKGVTLAQMRSTIEKTAQDLGWQLSDVQAGSFTARQEWGATKHNIVVGVVYDEKTFSIRYKDSKNMSFNGSSIHHTYNDMVSTLQDHIKTNVSNLTP